MTILVKILVVMTVIALAPLALAAAAFLPLVDLKTLGRSA